MKNNIVREDILTKMPILDASPRTYELALKKEYVYRFFKRTIDIIGSIFGIILLVPITIIIYLISLIKKERGPIFYTQQRIGKNGKTFKMYKYRSMIINADEVLEDYLQENEDARKEDSINKKLKDDPRVTKFINVFLGEMSLVGPRPYLPKEIEDMGEAYKEIIKLKPGLTGYWQVSGRNNISFKNRLKLDIEYSKKRNLKLDFQILFDTIKKVVKQEGAL